MDKPVVAQEPGPEVVPEESEIKTELALQQLCSENRSVKKSESRLKKKITITTGRSEEEDNHDYSPDEVDWKKTIMVGSDYQAAIPEGLCSYDDALPYENEDKLLWNPCTLDESVTEEYMKKICVMNSGTVPRGKQLRDDEEALHLLQQCGHNVEEALRRKRISAQTPANASLWSEEECRNFENGMRAHQKNFFLIRQNKVRTRSVGELVQFYYIWKKTERHDVFENKKRLEKKKYTLHPSHTNLMDRLVEEQEASGAAAATATAAEVVRPVSPTPMMDYPHSEPATQPDPLAWGEKEVFSQLNAHTPPPRSLSMEDQEPLSGS